MDKFIEQDSDSSQSGSSSVNEQNNTVEEDPNSCSSAQSKKRDKLKELKAVQKLGIDSLEELYDYFEDSEKEQFMSMYKMNKIMGSGGFGVVVSAIDIQFKKNVALKIVIRKDMKGEMLVYEYEILKELSHENIIKIYKIIKFTNVIIMSMKLTNENLADYARRRRKVEGNPLNEEECAQIMKGILNGLAYLHDEHNIIHRDLKPPNILVSSYRDLAQCKIIDFGIATQNKKEQLRKYGNIGTLVYQPPEQVINKFNYGKGADLWAAGIITYNLLTGKHPFVVGEDSTEEIKEKILQYKEIKYPVTMSKEAVHLISRLCTREQSHRYSAAEALRHPWITREVGSQPPLTKFERKNMIGEELMIEDKLRKVQGLIYFIGILKFNNSPKKSLIDTKYQLRLRSQELTKDFAVSKRSSVQRRMTQPSIRIEKTSSLLQKEELRNKLAAKVQELDHDDSQQDYFQLSNSSNQDALSPDVKEFLRQNRIRIRNGRGEPGSNKSHRSGSKQPNKSKTRKSSHQMDNESNLLSVPVKVKKRIATNSNASISDGSSPRSPMELKMNISGQFSDLDSSIDLEKSPQFSSQKGLKKPQKRSSQLPLIDERKSLQAKNGQQPIDILQRIKQQKTEVKDLKMSSKLAGSASITPQQNQNFENFVSSGQITKGRKGSKIPDQLLQLTNNSTSLSKMMQDHIKDEEEKKQVSRGNKLAQKIGAMGNKQRASSSNSNYRSINHDFQGGSSGQGNVNAGSSIQAGITTFDFNSISSNKQHGMHSKQPQQLSSVNAAQRAQMNMFMKNVQHQ